MRGLQDFGVRCPVCSGTDWVEEPGTSEVCCRSCQGHYRVSRGLVDLLPDRPHQPSKAQALMEWDVLVKLYESRLWRGSPFFALGMGISVEREYQTLLAAAGLRGDERMLDIGCGPGTYTRRFSQAVPDGCVVGLDLSLPMLRFAAKQGRDQGGRLLYVRADALRLPFTDASFDAVNCCGALHLFPEPPAAVAEVARVLKPGGRFALAVFRAGTSRRGQRMARLRREKWGLHSFTEQDMANVLVTAGLVAPVCHHARGVWLIMSAQQAAPRSEAAVASVPGEL